MSLLSWGGPLGAAAAGGLLRVWHLGSPHALVFDETYYVKDALSLITFGVERQAVEGADDLLLAGASAAELFTGSPAFVAHPPLGKWLIGAGMAVLGSDPFGWRIAAALASTLSILLLGRIVLRITGNALLGTLAAGLLALDGLHLVLGRTALLDTFLMLLVLAAFGALLRDREQRAGFRWWRMAAWGLLGLACGVKWSGLWYLSAFVALTLVWDAARRRGAGEPRPWRAALVRDAPQALVSLVLVGGAAYLATWGGWLLSPDGWGRQAAGTPLRALFDYHAAIYRFHIGLDKDHPYQAPAWSWLLQLRPTSFYYDGEGTGCGADRCAAAITALGNPVVWWAATVALAHQVYRATLLRDWRGAALVVGVLAGWVPWLFLPERTTFTFYAVVMAPFLAAALAMSLGQVLGTGAVAQRPWRVVAVGGFLLAVVLAAWWFWPIWAGQEITYWEWSRRMWLKATWI